MRKYRFHDGKPSFFRTALGGRLYHFLLFFAAWNTVAFGLYTFAQSGARKKDPAFENKSHTLQMLQMYGFNTSNMKYIKYKISKDGVKRAEIDEDGEEKHGLT